MRWKLRTTTNNSAELSDQTVFIRTNTIYSDSFSLVQPIKNQDINLALEIVKKSGKSFAIPISELREEISEKASKYASKDPYYDENQEIISKWRAENLDIARA